MGGLIGKFSKNRDIKSFNNALNLLVYNKNYICDSIFTSEKFLASRTHLNIIGESNSPYSIDGNQYFIWVEGEIYNFSKIKKNFVSFPNLLLNAYINNNLNNILSIIDGYFSSVIYDKKNSKILLITDRYGLKPLYYSVENSEFSWASEVKAFKYLIEKATIDNKAIDVFTEIGYITGDNTLFNEIKLLDASTVLEYNTKTKTINKKRYWSWSNIVPQNISFEDSVFLLHNKLKDAINKRLSGKKIGLTLSGGIDSRVLLSLLPNNRYPTITWGTKNSIDYLLAKKVVKKNKNKGYFLEFDSEYWFNERIYGVWKTDGMFNLMHMHASAYQERIKDIIDINLNGFAGDLNIGGSWIVSKNQKITKDNALKKIQSGVSLTNLNDNFYNINHEDPYYLDTRVRRFTNGGSIEHSKLVEQRKPFYDNDLMEFIYSIPDEYRVNGKLYYEMIKKYIPKLFNEIHTTHGVNIITGKTKIKLQNTKCFL